MSSSRAASAATSRRAKQELVRLLYGATTRCPRVLDYSRYSYSELKMAYRKMLQEVHPDRHYARRQTDPNASQHCQFVQLQDAWDQYEQVSKLGKLGDKNGDNQLGTFTQFGVGCSFSDNEEERNLRAEYTDQACRGWFSAGALTPSVTNAGKANGDTNIATNQRPLIDEDMFVSVKDLEAEEKNDGAKNDNKRPNGRRPSLVRTR